MGDHAKPYVGPLQKTVSRRAGESLVWCRAKRPEPATYVIGGGLGPQPLSTKVSYPAFSQPKTGHYPNINISYSKGPIYRSDSSMGRQALSTRVSSPSAKLGTSSRSDSDLLYNVFTYKPR